MTCQASEEDLLPKLEELGFEKGWGKDRTRIKETMNLLLDIMEAKILFYSCITFLIRDNLLVLVLCQLLRCGN